MAIDPGIFKAYDIRGLYGSQLDGEVALAIGRGFARVLSKLSGKPTAELRVGLGRDMRLTAPELAARYREGLLMEGADVLDAGQVGTEMLYFLVGSRELDGGLMCTASHNPKAYTGAKLVREGAIALSGDAGIQDIRRVIEQGFDDGGGPHPLGTPREVDVYEEFQAAALALIDPDAIKPLKVVVDGGNGMAGPMVGPLLERLGLELIETYWTPDGNFPDHEPNPLLPENRGFIIEKVRETGADLGIAWDGTPIAASSSTTPENSSMATSSPRCWPSRCCARTLARPSSTTCGPAGRSPTPSSALAAPRTSIAWATPSSRPACERRAPCSEARSPGTTTSVTSIAPTRARSRRF